jgi:hypothetical protein
MTRLPIVIAAAMLLSAGAALAQDALNPPPPPGAPGPGMPHPPMEGRGGWMGMHHGHMGMMMMPRGAAFRFKKDGAEIDIHCAANEPTKACVDAAGTLIDKVTAAAPK